MQSSSSWPPTPLSLLACPSDPLCAPDELTFNLPPPLLDEKVITVHRPGAISLPPILAMLNGAPVVRPYWGYERAKKSSLAQAPPPERVAAKRALEGIHDDAEASRKKRATGDGPSLNPPSPLSLDGAEATPAVSIDEEATEDDADIYQPEASRPTLKTTGKPASTASASRKASHSVIERRRRERINETLAKLSELVPGCRAALEAKDAKSSTRSRRKSDRAGGKVMMGETALNVGGLHKLDVLLATVEHIEWLHKELGSRFPSSSASTSPAGPSRPTEEVNSAAASLLALASPALQPIDK